MCVWLISVLWQFVLLNCNSQNETYNTTQLKSLFANNQLPKIHFGYNQYTTYYQGNSPIIILSQHGGLFNISQDLIPNRKHGCLTENEKCIYDQNQCHDQLKYNNNNNDTYHDDLSKSKCSIKTMNDAFTSDISQWLYENLYFKDKNGEKYFPHFIANNLPRNKLDSNREIESAAQGNSLAINAFNEIHHKWMTMAKKLAMEQCGWALILDIHGHRGEFVLLGYGISADKYSSTNILNQQSMNNSVYSLFNRQQTKNSNILLSDIIIGNSNSQHNHNSLGDYYQQYATKLGSHGKITPSQLYPNPGANEVSKTDYYFKGGYAAMIHGMKHVNDDTDVIQIEIGFQQRWDAIKRDIFQNAFKQAVIDFAKEWYEFNQPNCFQPE